MHGWGNNIPHDLSPSSVVAAETINALRLHQYVLGPNIVVKRCGHRVDNVSELAAVLLDAGKLNRLAVRVQLSGLSSSRLPEYTAAFAIHALVISERVFVDND